MDASIVELANSWANNPYFDLTDRNELKELLTDSKKNEKEITERFYRDLEFGTGGLRSIIGFGRNRMNKYNVRKATQAMANVALKSGQSHLKFAISYDSRRFSKEFAQEACAVLAGNGIASLIYRELTPTPMLSFCIRNQKCIAGIMVTASHNPREYNGYKAYWSEGGQVIPPQDKEIINAYNMIKDWSEVRYLTFNEGIDKGLIQWVDPKVDDLYYEVLHKTAVKPSMLKEHGNKLKVVYTPLHGTGTIAAKRIATELGLSNFIVVPEQAKPDSNFSTVQFPNPEYPEALKMATDLMIKEKADLALGTDPDADRLGVAINHQGKVVFLNGNQIALLLIDYILGHKKLPKNSYIIKSIVTSELQTTIAQAYNIKMYNTLTGFKWMGALMSELEKNSPDEKFVFASEESFGYMPHNSVRDKDGISALALMCEVALHHKLNNTNLIDALDELYQKYGFALEGLLSIDYLGKEGSEKIVRIMEHFRTSKSSQFGEETIVKIEDLDKGKGRDLVNGSEYDLNFPKSNVIGLYFKSGNILWLRPSGTEPKIKFYSMVKVDTGTLAEKKEKAQAKINQIENLVKNICEQL